MNRNESTEISSWINELRRLCKRLSDYEALVTQSPQGLSLQLAVVGLEMAVDAHKILLDENFPREYSESFSEAVADIGNGCYNAVRQSRQHRRAI